ncbi:hypothetical protein AAMO2058_000536500 [Amorphochlora amoebiformis]|eukprot:1391889-Amorphochlora_amoeboformis.AAC.2
MSFGAPDRLFYGRRRGANIYLLPLLGLAVFIAVQSGPKGEYLGLGRLRTTAIRNLFAPPVARTMPFRSCTEHSRSLSLPQAVPEDLQSVPESVMKLLEEKYAHLEEKEKYRRIRISLSRQGSSPSSSYRHSDEMRRKISEKTRQALQRPDVRDKMKSIRHQPIPEEVRKKIGESVAKTYAAMPKEKKAKSPEHRRKIAESIRKKWADRAYREKATSGMSKAMIKKWEDPAYREKKESRTRAGGAIDLNSARQRTKARVKLAPLTDEAKSIIALAQKIQESRSKLIRIANTVEVLAKQGAQVDKKNAKTIKQAREALNILREKIEVLIARAKTKLTKYLNIRTGIRGRKALMLQAFEQFALKEVYDEVVESKSAIDKAAAAERKEEAAALERKEAAAEARRVGDSVFTTEIHASSEEASEEYNQVVEPLDGTSVEDEDLEWTLEDLSHEDDPEWELDIGQAQ